MTRNVWWQATNLDEGWQGFVVDHESQEDGHVGMLVEMRSDEVTFRCFVDVCNVRRAADKTTYGWPEITEIANHELTTEDGMRVHALVGSFLNQNEDKGGRAFDIGMIQQGATEEEAFIGSVDENGPTPARRRETGAKFSTN